MEAIIIKMAACLLGALALGFLFGWFIKRALEKETTALIVEDLEAELVQNKETLFKLEKHTEGIQEQYISNKEVVTASALKMQSLEENINSYKVQINALENNLTQTKESLKEHLTTNEELTDKLQQTEKVLVHKKAEVTAHLEQINTIKEEQSTLKDFVNSSKHEQEINNQAINKLMTKIENYKENEATLIQEKATQASKLAALQTNLGNKDIIEIELKNREKEIQALEEKNIQLNANLKTAHTQTEEALQENKRYQKSLQEIQHKLDANIPIKQNEIENIASSNANEGFFHNLEHSIKENVSTLGDKSKKEGFDFLTFAKRTIKKVTESGEDIIAKGDKALKDYKNLK